MASALVVGSNTYVTQAEADSYLADSISAAAAWATTSATKKAQALITAFRRLETQRWSGTQSATSVVATAVVAAGGTGYVVNEILTAVGGTFGEASQVKVTSVSGGAVTAVQLVRVGNYTSEPTSPVATTGSTNDDCTLTLTFTTQTADWPRASVVDCAGNEVDEDTVPADIESAQIEYAYLLTQDTSLEGSTSTGSNNKKLKAGSAEIEYFKPTDGTRFPATVQELIGCYVSGVGGSGVVGTAQTGGAEASGTGCPSSFDSDCKTSGLNSAWP